MTRIRRAGLLAVIAAALVVAPVAADTFDAPMATGSWPERIRVPSGGIAYTAGSGSSEEAHRYHQDLGVVFSSTP